MRRFVNITSAALLLVAATSSQAALIFYNDRATFDAANPTTTLEGFQNCNDITAVFTGPLDSTSNNAFCAPGDVAAGISFVDEPGPDNGGLFSAATGQSTNPTQALGSNSPRTDALDVAFSVDVNAVALDIYQNDGGGAQTGQDQDYLVEVFDINGLLGSTTVTVASSSFGFFGVRSDADLITLVRVRSNNGLFEVIDDIAFGQQVSEPAPLALLGIGLLAMVGARRRR